MASFADRLRCEALRHYERAQGRCEDQSAVLRSQAAGGSFEQRLCHRAATLAGGLGLDAALQRIERTASRLAWATALLALLAGAATARGVLGTPADGPVSFYLVLGVMLGLNLLALLLWLLGTLLAPRRAPPLAAALGALLRRLVRRAAVRGAGDPAPLDASAAAWLGLYSRPELARWSFGLLVHGVWLAALTGMLASTLLMLSTRQYDFVWETTILPDSAFVTLTGALAAAPRALGWPVPDAALAGASRRGAPAPSDPAQARTAWSGLLTGALVLYGIGPRAGLWLLCALARARARQRLRLPVALPEYARLRPGLMPTAQPRGVVDAAPPAPARRRPEATAETLPAAPPGLRVLGLEMDTPVTGWPPALLPHATDLGLVHGREDLEAALARLGARAAPLWLVGSLLSPPDRGLLRSLTRLCQQAPAGLSLLLTQAGRAQRRLGEAGCRQRIEDWRTLAASAGVPARAVHLLDLDDSEALRAAIAEGDGRR